MYNRPSSSFGCLSTKKFSNDEIIKQKVAENSTILVDSKNYHNVIRSLADFYGSIPDYGDISHLPAKEFYSTLTSLRATCQDIKRKSMYSFSVEKLDTNKPSSRMSCYNEVSSIRRRVSKKTKTQKNTSKNSKAHTTPCPLIYGDDDFRDQMINGQQKFDFIDHMKLKRYSEQLKSEIENFGKTLKYLQPEELQKNSVPLLNQNRNSKIELVAIERKCEENNAPKYAVEETSTTGLSSHQSHHCVLRKSYSLNNIEELKDDQNGVGEKTYRKSTVKHKFSKAEEPQIQKTGSVDKLSNYFTTIATSQDIRKSKCRSATALSPKLPCSEHIVGNNLFFECKFGKRYHKKKRKTNKFIEKPLLFTSSDLNKTCRRQKYDKLLPQSIPSPRHPAARPNLAATLRAEVSRRKLLELQNTCMYRDEVTPQSDWEVRKTPAWKCLAFNESHEEMISQRLATRKLEQALQQRNFEQNMDIMRQRVKAAPLLLEGCTYWGTGVGRSTHSCKQAGLKHSCRQLKQGQGASGGGGQGQAKANCDDSIQTHAHMGMGKRRSKHSNGHSLQSSDSGGVDYDLTSTDRAYL